MVRKLDLVAGMREKKILEHLRHRNIVKINYAFYEGDVFSLGLKYCCFTLGQILYVYFKLEVQQVQHIARSVSLCGLLDVFTLTQ